MFDLKGYELVRNFFDPKEILNESNKVINAAQKKKWKFIKVYHNIYIKDFVNIFCISFPFNNFFDAKILEKLEDINYKKKILEITRFNDIESSQIELQHNSKYNYQSSWHRDWNGISTGNVVLILFLSDEKGFKIVPKNNEAKLKNINGITPENYKTGYKNIPKEYYDTIDAKGGDFIIFDAGLLHQGNAKGKRTHLLIRHNELKNLNKKDEMFSIYNFKNYLRPEAKIEELEKLGNKDSYNFNSNYYSFNKRIKSIFNLFFYYFPILKIIKYFFDFKKKKTHFHYSIFQ